MIDSYASAGEYDTALRIFCEMQRIHDPDGYTMQSVISSCAGLGALSLNLWAHAYVLKSSDKNMIGEVLVNTSLCDSFKILYDKRYNLFHYPVSDEDAPNYHSIIQNSMDMVYNGEDYNGDRIVHGMISQMDPTLVAYGDKIVAQGGPVHLSNELRWSTFPATPVVQLGTATRLSARLRNESHVKLKFQMIRQINLLG
ncbi:hypothetical protein Ahy_A04g021024 [Arachis hypogaea]|uniref:Pentatricopeptide repeat-containing protein n=1 Tax=Arachis hypogaea TaxID=3818 RepID=A0A445DJG2_ARAHY|nr:hypothetical protein Ahy_A04g021024 [Arachis hypogaea]